MLSADRKKKGSREQTDRRKKMILTQGYIEVQAPCDNLMRTQIGGNPERQHCDDCGVNGVLIHDSVPPQFVPDKPKTESAALHFR